MDLFVEVLRKPQLIEYRGSDFTTPRLEFGIEPERILDIASTRHVLEECIVLAHTAHMPLIRPCARDVHPVKRYRTLVRDK